MIIFDCNGVLVDSEPLATSVVSEEFVRAGFNLTPDVVAHYFTGRRAADIFNEVELASGRKLPENFSNTVAAATLRRFRDELRPMAHAAHALTWLRGRKCVASSASLDRIRMSLETTGLLRFFEPYLYSAADVGKGKPSPDIYLHVAARSNVRPDECIVVEDSPVGVAAAAAAGMTAVGFIGGSHAGPQLGAHLMAAGARVLIADMRALKTTIVNLRGW